MTMGSSLSYAPSWNSTKMGRENPKGKKRTKKETTAEKRQQKKFRKQKANEEDNPVSNRQDIPQMMETKLHQQVTCAHSRGSPHTALLTLHTLTTNPSPWAKEAKDSGP